MNSAPCFAIFGPPRTGGNPLARILQELGVYVGERFAPPNDWQPEGFYQDLDFHDAIGAAIGPALLAEMPLRAAGDCKALETLIASRNTLGKPWGFSHPKSALVVANLVAICGDSLRPIRTTRNFHESVLSYQARAKASLDEAILAIGRHEHVVSEAVDHFKLTPLVVDFGALVADPAGQVKRLADYAGLPVTSAAVAAVNPALKRFGGAG